MFVFFPSPLSSFSLPHVIKTFLSSDGKKNSGFSVIAIAYHVQGLVIQKRGPVFVTAFSPSTMIIDPIVCSFILARKIYLGG